MRSKSLFLAPITVIAISVFVPSIASAQLPPEGQETVTTNVIESNAQVSSEKRILSPPNRKMLAAGVALFGVPYLASVAVAITSHRDANHMLYIPAVGPWLALGQRDCSGDQPCAGKVLSAGLLIADGIAQDVGIAVAAASFLLPEQTTTLKVGKAAKVTFTPTRMGAGAYGIGAVGEF
jgi:hypothetical protein